MNKFLQFSFILIIFSICFMYPITSILFLLLDLSSSELNFYIRVIFVIYYIFVFFVIFIDREVKYPSFFIPFILFFVAYSIRLVIDIHFRNIQMVGYSYFYNYSYWFGLTILPLLVLVQLRNYVVLNKLLSVFFYSIVIINILQVFYFLNTGSADFYSQLSQRSEVAESGNDNIYRAVINPIRVGYFGALLISFVFSCSYSRLSGFNLPFFKYKFLYYGLGLTSIFLSASRGPVVALILSILYIYLIRFKYFDSKFKILFNLSFYLFLGFLIFNYFVRPFENDLFLIQRFYLFFENFGTGDKEIRNYSFEGALNDFYVSPIWGRQYVGTYDNFYPHNIFLEVLMSLGVIGGFLFFIILLRYFKILFSSPYDYYFSVCLPLFSCSIVSFFLSLTSGSILSSPDFWIILVIVYICNYLKSYSINLV